MNVLIECESNHDIEHINSILSSDAHLSVKVPTKKDPRVQILGIPKEINKKDILESIKAQNNGIKALCDENPDEKLSVIFEKDHKDNGLTYGYVSRLTYV
ncbi:hypothetical protein BLOT_007926 [Blomia tropicalis]|nr:hypothetical protein BLOT_007926 [Blomia tropicalis]